MSSADTPSPPPRRQSDANAPPGGVKKKKRVRNWTAEDRAAHRVLERSRREAFKERLTKLAALIPSLETTDPNRLSKHVVVDESIALHNQQRQQIDQLSTERDQLLAEIQRLRSDAEQRDTAQSLSGVPNSGDLRGLADGVQNQPSLPGQPWSGHQGPDLGQPSLPEASFNHQQGLMPGSFGHAHVPPSAQVPGNGLWDPANMGLANDPLAPAVNMASGRGPDRIPLDPAVYHHMGSDGIPNSNMPFGEPQMEANSALLHYSGNYSG